MSTTQIFKLIRKSGDAAMRVCVAGVGTAGVRVVDRISGGNPAEATLAALHANRAVLAASQAQTKIPLGGNALVGGCGGRVALGRKAAEHDVEMVRGLISDCQALIVVAGLGGGTATGALPVILQAAAGSGVFTAVLLTMPFGFEGHTRQQVADDGLRAILPLADFTAVVANTDLLQAQQAGTAERAFEGALDVLASGVCSLWQILAMPSLLALDQGDLRAMGTQDGSACRFTFGMGTGENRALDAAEALLASHPEVRTQVAGGGGILACVCASRDLQLDEIATVLEPLHETAPETGLFRAGVVLHESWRDRMFLSVFLGDTRRKVTATVRNAAATGVSKGKAGSSPRAAQEEFKLEGATASGQGRFVRTKATILDGEDLDIPTYIRRNITLDR